MESLERFTVREAAEYLRMSRSTLYRLCATKKVRHCRVGIQTGKIVFRKADLDDYLERSTIETDGIPQVRGIPSLKYIRIKRRG